MANKLIGLGVIIFALGGCDAFHKPAFDRFCERNLRPLPETKIKVEGIEFRGDFNLMRIFSWGNFAKFVEFTTSDIGSQIPSNSEFRQPSVLIADRYRMQNYKDWNDSCRDYRIFINAPKQLSSEFFEERIKFMKETPAATCQGITPIEEFEAEIIVEREDIPGFAMVMGRRVFARFLHVRERESGKKIGDLRLFAMRSAEDYQGFSELPQEYVCTSIKGRSKIGTEDLSVLFEELS